MHHTLQEEGRTALSLALLEEREDIADLVLSIDETDVNNPDAVVSIIQRSYVAIYLPTCMPICTILPP